MAVEKHAGGITITGDHVMVFQYIRVAHGLALEINTGMSMSGRGSVMKLAASYCGSAKRTKKGVLREYVAWLEANLPHTADGPWKPSGSIVRAIES